MNTTEINRSFRRRLALLALVLGGIQTSGASVEQYTISGSRDVADVALRGNGFGDWNYGRGIPLEAGYFIGFYDTHPGASLLRFSVSGLEVGRVKSATVGLFKPRSVSQQGPVDVSVSRVSKANGDWVEGGSASQREPGRQRLRVLSCSSRPVQYCFVGIRPASRDNYVILAFFNIPDRFL